MIRLAVAGAALVVACASDSSPEEVVVDCATEGRYLALHAGASWTYDVTTSNGTHAKTQTIGALEDVGGAKAGIMAFRVTTTKPGGMVVSWQEDVGSAVVRHRERDLAGATSTDELYLPRRTRFDESPAHLVAGATWVEVFDEAVTDLATGQTTTTSKSETWTVEATDVGIRVAAGDFCTIRVQRTSSVNGSAGSNKRYWFARGVGKIREQNSAGDVEELSEYTP